MRHLVLEPIATLPLRKKRIKRKIEPADKFLLWKHVSDHKLADWATLFIRQADGKFEQQRATRYQAMGFASNWTKQRVQLTDGSMSRDYNLYGDVGLFHEWLRKELGNET